MATDNPETGTVPEAAAAPEADGQSGAQPKTAKPPRSPGERALANLRTAKRLQGDISDPAERTRMLLAEANVLALLDLADALARPADSRNGGG